MKSKRGAFIVLEGCDRVGKSTQVKRIAEELSSRNIPIATFVFPDRSTPLGKQIDQCLRVKGKSVDRERLQTLFADNRREFEAEMRRLLAEGTTLIVDRYSYSGVAFGLANNLDKKWCWELESGLPKPDLVLFLSMSIDKAATRCDYGNELYDKLDFQGKVLQEYMQMVDSSWKIVDVNDKDVNTVKMEILEHVTKTISQVCYKPLTQFS